ncbi:MAG: prolipoprotein diacylglyceryl transferase [Anaeromyxobacteraceae bacterium]
MLPVIFTIVIPAGFGKPVALGLFVLFVVGRAIAYVRRAKAEGHPVSFVQALKDDAFLVVILAAVVGVLWSRGLLDGRRELPLHTYGLLIASAFLVGIWLSQREGARRGQDPEKIADLSFWILVAALVGSRVYYILLHLDDYFGPGRFMAETAVGSIPRILAVWEGGLVFYGGFIGAVLAAILYMRANRMNFLAHADTMIPQVALGHFLGRLGCFAAGCCWGGRMTGEHAWGAKFGTESLAYQTLVIEKPELIAPDHLHTVALHPTQLYEAFGELGLFFVLVLLVRPRKQFHGQVLAAWLMMYGIQRSITELFRGDLDRGYLAGINSAQWTSVFIFAAGLAVWAIGRRARAALAPAPA